MHRVQTQSVFAQRIADFAHSLRVAITEMLRSAENFHRRKSGLRDFRQQGRAKRLVHKPVRGKDALHSARGGGALWSMENAIPSIAHQPIRKSAQTRAAYAVSRKQVPRVSGRLTRPATTPPESIPRRAGACASVPGADV